MRKQACYTSLWTTVLEGIYLTKYGYSKIRINISMKKWCGSTWFRWFVGWNVFTRWTLFIEILNVLTLCWLEIIKILNSVISTCRKSLRKVCSTRKQAHRITLRLKCGKINLTIQKAMCGLSAVSSTNSSHWIPHSKRPTWKVFSKKFKKVCTMTYPPGIQKISPPYSTTVSKWTQQKDCQQLNCSPHRSSHHDFKSNKNSMRMLKITTTTNRS